MVYCTSVVKNHNRDELSRCVSLSSRSRRSPWLEGNVMKLLLFRHHVLSRVTSMLSDFTPYALCHMLHPFTLCLSFDLIFIVIVDVICLLTPYPELHRIYAYSPITHLWLHPQLRSTTAHYAPLTLLVSSLLSRFIFIPRLIIQSDGTTFPYLV